MMDAEERAVRGEQLVRRWLVDLHHLAYRASDLLGLYEYEVIAKQVRDQNLQRSLRATAGRKRKWEELDQVHDFTSDLSLPASTSPLYDSSFRREFAHSIRKFQEEFENINKLKEDLHFDVEGVRIDSPSNYDDMMEQQSTGSNHVDHGLFGREAQLEELIQLLLDDDIEENNRCGDSIVPVIALVGMGGVGKTTLAQYAFNDPDVCNHYSKKGWVCVSEDFDVRRLSKSTLEALNRECDSMELNILQCSLQGELKGTKYLLVFDDVWNENEQLWSNFCNSLKHGAKGSKIIITSRSKRVAHTAQATRYIDVDCLSDNDGWALFQMIAFEKNIRYRSKHPALMDIGKKIAKKCSGLPLAIKVLGSYLRYEDKDENIWNDVLNSDLWEPHQWKEGKQVLGPLTLSYLRLPTYLKTCFLISSVFPKDHKIHKKELMNLWMAHELIEDYKEDVSMRYIQNLVSRSFLVELEYDFVTMHDLIHDLAQYLTRDTMFHCHYGNMNDRDPCILHDVHHAFFNGNAVGIVARSCRDAKYTSSLRTLLVKSQETSSELAFPYIKQVKMDGLRKLKYHEERVEDDGILHDYLKSLKNLRELDLYISPQLKLDMDVICSLYNLRILTMRLSDDWSFDWDNRTTVWLPDSIGNLRHLISLSIDNVSYIPDAVGCLTKLCRLKLWGAMVSTLPRTISKLVNIKELNLSHSRIEELPESIGNLRALQILELRSCYGLAKLPENIANLTNLTKIELENLDDDNSYRGYYPIGFGRLKKLQQSLFFPVPPKKALTEYAGIEELKDLEAINGCLRISCLKNVAKQEDAMSAELKNKKDVWYLVLDWGPFEEEEEEDEEEEELILKDETVLECLTPNTNVRMLYINKWRGRRLAWWLGHASFVHLQNLALECLPNCTSLWPLHELRSLEKLSIKELPNCTSLHPLQQLPLLQELTIRSLPKLSSFWPLHQLPLLKVLSIDNLPDLSCLWRPSQLPPLENLSIKKSPSRTFFGPPGKLASLEQLSIKRVRNCTSLCPLYELPSLKYVDCINMTSLVTVVPTSFLSADKEVTKNWFPVLESLTLEDCSQLATPSEIYKHNPLLEELGLDIELMGNNPVSISVKRTLLL